MMTRPDRYTLPMRLLHCSRAALILGLIALGWTMTSLSDDGPPSSPGCTRSTRNSVSLPF